MRLMNDMETINPIIRQAQPSDASELHRLNELFNGKGCNSLENIKEKLSSNTSETVCVAGDGEKLIGFCCSQIFKSFCYPIDYAEITELFVLDECRRHGVGKRLLSFMETELKKHGVQHLHILTFNNNIAAKALYNLCGYADTSEMLLDKNFVDGETDGIN